MVVQFFLCFSLIQNTRLIMDTNVPSTAITSINGMRVLSMWWVILGHTYSVQTMWTIPVSKCSLIVCTCKSQLSTGWTTELILKTAKNMRISFLTSLCSRCFQESMQREWKCWWVWKIRGRGWGIFCPSPPASHSPHFCSIFCSSQACSSACLLVHLLVQSPELEKERKQLVHRLIPIYIFSLSCR